MDGLRRALSRWPSSALHRRGLAGTSGVLLGGALGAALVLLVGSAVAYRPAAAPGPVLDATHLPPLLTMPGEPVELRYDIHCSAEGDVESDAPCDAAGTVFVRRGAAGPYQELPLRIDSAADEGRYVAIVPSDIVRGGEGFSYYAVFRSEIAGMTLTLPSAGASAPQKSTPLDRVVSVSLGKHDFGVVRRADSRVLSAGWGNGPNEIGLEQGRNLPPTGGSSFDIGPDGTVHLLDQVHKRLLRWAGSSTGSRPETVPLSISGTLADLAVAADGSIYVLEMAAAERKPILRVFGPDGKVDGVVQIAERTASQVRMGSRGPIVLQHPAGQWMPAAIDGRLLAPPAQKAAGRPGRGVAGGDEVVVLRTENEIRAAMLGENRVRWAWRVTSETPVAEVQLAELVGNRMVLVVRLYTDDEDEFAALVLGPGGLVRSFSLDSADWAETAPLSRFRIGGSALYRLGSTQRGLFVDRFELEVG